MKKILIPSALLAFEIAITAYKYNLSFNLVDANYPFSLSDALFIWSVLFFFLSMAVMFGVENKYVFASFVDPHTSYAANVANLISSTAKNFHSRFYDFSTGVSILCLSLLNFIIYLIVNIIG